MCQKKKNTMFDVCKATKKDTNNGQEKKIKKVRKQVGKQQIKSKNRLKTKQKTTVMARHELCKQVQ